MCEISCNSDHFTEGDARTTYLSWENGQYAPAPSMFYVPGLRPIFQKQARRARRTTTARRSVSSCKGNKPCHTLAYPGLFFNEGPRKAHRVGTIPRVTPRE